MIRHRRPRHTARARGLSGIPAARLIATHRPAGTLDFAPDDTVRLLLPGLLPALAAR